MSYSLGLFISHPNSPFPPTTPALLLFTPQAIILMCLMSLHLICLFASSFVYFLVEHVELSWVQKCLISLTTGYFWKEKGSKVIRDPHGLEKELGNSASETKNIFFPSEKTRAQGLSPQRLCSWSLVTSDCLESTWEEQHR